MRSLSLVMNRSFAGGSLAWSWSGSGVMVVAGPGGPGIQSHWHAMAVLVETLAS